MEFDDEPPVAQIPLGRLLLLMLLGAGIWWGIIAFTQSACEWLTR